MIMRFPEVVKRTGLSRSTVYRLLSERKFPSQVQLTSRSVGWYARDIEAWLQERQYKHSGVD
jgi:prophage regulatory protein